jgi:hypothetical protein
MPGRAKSTGMDFTPAHLPDIDIVEVVDLSGVEPDRVGDYMPVAGNAPHVRLTGDSAQHLARLWRLLPPGGGIRCHLPPFGLRFYKDGEVLLQASLCWQCNNLYGNVKGESIGCAFDARSDVAQELLSWCVACSQARVLLPTLPFKS